MTSISPQPQSNDPLEHKRKSDRRKENFDDAIEVIEAIAEEAGGIGIAKRLFEKVKVRVSREYIERIEVLEDRQEQLLQTNSVLTRMGEECVERIDSLKEENAKLRIQIRELECSQNR